jgi:hypothetical protein
MVQTAYDDCWLYGAMLLLARVQLSQGNYVGHAVHVLGTKTVARVGGGPVTLSPSDAVSFPEQPRLRIYIL